MGTPHWRFIQCQEEIAVRKKTRDGQKHELEERAFRSGMSMNAYAIEALFNAGEQRDENIKDISMLLVSLQRVIDDVPSSDERAILNRRCAEIWLYLK